ncbi:hypothetical protein D3C80_523470 [compost metagenome]
MEVVTVAVNVFHLQQGFTGDVLYGLQALVSGVRWIGVVQLDPMPTLCIDTMGQRHRFAIT